MSDMMHMTGERLIWACALAIEKQYGDAASDHVTARIAALAARDDEAGLERWRAIGARLDQLRWSDDRAS